MLQCVAERRGAVLAHDVHALHHAVARTAVLDLFDDQGADHRRRRRFAVGGRRVGPDQRQHGHVLGVRLVDIRLQRFFDLRRHVRRIARVPHRLAGCDDGRGQVVQKDDLVRAVIHHVLAADRFDAALLVAFAKSDADPIAADQPPCLVDDRERGLGRFQAGVSRARKILQLVPQRLPIRELTQLARAEEVTHQLAHLHQEFQVAALRTHVAAGPLKDLDQALRLSLDLHGAEHEQQRRRIGRPCHRRRRRHRRTGQPASAFAAAQYFVQQSTVPRGFVFVFAEARLAQVDLIFEL